MEIVMPQDEQAAPEIAPLPDFLRTLAEGLRANAQLDQELVAILETNLINVEPTKESGAAAANVIERLAAQRAEADHA